MPHSLRVLMWLMRPIQYNEINDSHYTLLSEVQKFTFDQMSTDETEMNGAFVFLQLSEDIFYFSISYLMTNA